MALQNAEKRHFHSEQNGSCIQQLIEMHGIFAHDFAIKVPALLARKSREPRTSGLCALVDSTAGKICPEGWDIRLPFEELHIGRRARTDVRIQAEIINTYINNGLCWTRTTSLGSDMSLAFIYI
jgi:hypothetical protein